MEAYYWPNVNMNSHYWLVVKMEGNPVWSNSSYTHQLITNLPQLNMLDQQDITQVTIKLIIN